MAIVILIAVQFIWLYVAYKAYDDGYKDGYYVGLNKNGELE